MNESQNMLSVRELVKDAKVLMVGSGGIGCELLKCLAQAGFKNIEVVDMDTIEVSNLNRQFLFRREHVGKPKAEVAKNSVARQYPNTNIISHVKNIIDDEFSVSWFKRFTLVMNALDNFNARTHVNRMCLAAEIPLIDTGTAGYEGQVEVILKGVTKCYECSPKPQTKTYPSCTIRNTPTELIHCIVWSKHLFNQLFGEADDEAEVSPDTADPELSGTAAQSAMDNVSSETGLVARVSTRGWARECQYDHVKLFNKFFNEDILYLLSLKDLWEKRKPPVPLNWQSAISAVVNGDKETKNVSMKDQKLWSINECAEVFAKSCENLKNRLLKKETEDDEDPILHWDKDDKYAMDFVAACANIRAHIFSIEPKTRYDIKSMAGNIVPAIATSNAMIAGLSVFFAFNILRKDIESCKTVYLRKEPNHEGVFIAPEKYLSPPNPKCYVCSQNPEVLLCLDAQKMTVGQLRDEVFLKYFKMVQPEVTVQGPGTVIISDDFDEIFYSKMLSELGVKEGTVLLADDYLQTCSFFVYIKKKDDSDEVNNREVVSLFTVEQTADIKRLEDCEDALLGFNADGPIENGNADDVEIIESGQNGLQYKDMNCKRAHENGDLCASKKVKMDE